MNICLYCAAPFYACSCPSLPDPVSVRTPAPTSSPSPLPAPASAHPYTDAHARLGLLLQQTIDTAAEVVYAYQLRFGTASGGMLGPIDTEIEALHRQLLAARAITEAKDGPSQAILNEMTFSKTV